MERVQELIDKLGKQHQQHESPERLLATLQTLQEVLAGMVRKEPPAAAKVSVVLPQVRRATTVAVGMPVAQALPPKPPIAEGTAMPTGDIKAAAAEGQKPYVPDEQPAQKQNSKAAAAELQVPDESQKPYAAPAAAQPAGAAPEVPAAYAAYMPVPEAQNEKAPYLLQPPAAEPALPGPQPTQSPQREEREIYHLHFDTPDEAAPTLTQQQYGKAPKELHEMISETRESLNDRLKQDKPELSHRLKELPIKDLRKAIGLNDKFLFLRELFRGDEAMYERSLKTINNFHILAEAEYWISRELKVKLGWDDGSHTVQAFYQLVKRRFS